MMDEKRLEQIKQHENLVTQLLSRCQVLDSRVAELDKECNELRDKVRMKEEAYDELLSQFKIYKMSMSLGGNTKENEEAKRYISHMISEIDKCIKMLNE